MKSPVLGRRSLHTATVIIMIVVCAVVPFVSCRKDIVDVFGTTVDAFGYYKSVLLCILAFLSVMLLLCNKYLNRDATTETRLKRSLLLFTFWAAVSTCFSFNVSTSFFGSSIWHGGLWLYVSVFIFYTLAANFLTAHHLKIFLYTALGSSSLMALLSVLEFYGIDLLTILFPNIGTSATQVHATFGNSNVVGGYFATMAPLAMMLFVHSETRKDILFSALFTMSTIVGLIVSGSRVSWISVIVVFPFCLFLVKQSVPYKRIVAITVFTIAAAFILNKTSHQLHGRVTDAIEQAVHVKAHSDIREFGSYRVYAYEKFVNLTLESPRRMLVGVGPDCLKYFGSALSDMMKFPVLRGVTFSKAHSDLVEYLATMGIPSLLFYLSFVFSIFVAGVKGLKNASPEMTAVFAAWLGYLLQSLFNIPHIGVVPIFFVLSGIIENHWLSMIPGEQDPGPKEADGAAFTRQAEGNHDLQVPL